MLTDGHSGAEYARYDVSDGSEFSVAFIHSVNKSEVKEGYVIQGEEIYLETCLYSAFGAGVATELEGDQTLTYTDSGEMLIGNIHTLMPNLAYIVGTVSDHVLEVNGQEISLRDLCGRNNLVRFQVERNKVDKSTSTP